MIPNNVPSQPPYKLQLWPAHLLILSAFGVAVLTCIYPSATREYTWPSVPWLSLFWLTPLAAVIGRLAFRNSWTAPNKLLCIGLGVLTAATALSAAFSPFVEHSLLRIWPTIGGVALFFWLHDWLAESAQGAPSRAQFLTRGLTGFGALLVLVSMIGWSWRYGEFAWATRNDFPFGHSIYNAGALLLVLPWLVYASLNAKGIERMGWVVATVTGFVALLTTSSRGGVLAAGAVCMVAAGYVFIRARWPVKIKASVVIIAVTLVAFAVWSNPRLRELARGQAWSESAHESNVQRNAMLEAGVKLGLARPWIGWGPGTIPLVYPQVRRELSGGVDSVLQLHNTPAQIWATLGCGGALASLILLGAFGRRLWQIAYGAPPSPLTLTSAASLLGYGLFMLTDHELDVPAMNALLVLNLALFFFCERVPSSLPVSRAAKWRFSLALVIILLPPLFLTGRDLLARFAYEQSLILFGTGRINEGYEYLETAAQRAPYDPYYRHQYAGRLLEQRAQTKDKPAQARLTARAISELEKSLSSGCLQEFAHFNLGWLALETNEPARAIPHFLATVSEAPHRGGAYLGLGFALQGAGHESEAVRAYALEWINDPSCIAAPLWEWPDFAPLRPKILHEANTLIAELAATHPTARYVRELWAWWENEAPAPQTGFNQETKAFVQVLAALDKNQPPPSAAASYNWALLLNAWLQPPEHHAFAALTKHDENFSVALVHRAARHAPPRWHDFLTAGLENEPYLLVDTRFARSGYGVLALHPDGPVLTNLYVMQQNRLVATFASTLFPPKGWLKAGELLKRLPATP